MALPAQLIVPIAAALPIAVGGLGLGRSSSAEQRRWLQGAFLYCVVYQLSLTVPHLVGIRLGHWNWLGKMGGIAVSLASCRVAGLTRDDVGWRLPRNKEQWVAAILGAATLAALSAAERLSDAAVRPFDVETLLFQATVPGLDEEFAYRGVLLAMLLRVLPGRSGIVWAGTPVTIAFWLVHVLQVAGRTISVPSLRLDTLFAAVGFVLIVQRTDSVLAAMAAHDLDNLLDTCFRGAWIWVSCPRKCPRRCPR